MLALTLTADLTGVTELLPLDTAAEPFFYTFKPLRSSTVASAYTVAIPDLKQETSEVSGSKGEANFVWRCKVCKRESTASIKDAPRAYIQESPPKSQKIIEIDCRGLEFTEFRAEGEWTAKGVDSSTRFTAVDLQEGEWFDYDEKSGEEVSIKDLKWEIKRA